MPIPVLPSLVTDRCQTHLYYWVMLELHHNQHFKGFYNWAIKFTSARGGGWGEKKRENQPISLGTVPPSSNQFSTREILVQNKALRSCYAKCTEGHMGTVTHRQSTSAAMNLLLSSMQNSQFNSNSSRNINLNCRWTFTTNYFQGQVKLNTTHLFEKNRISTRD